MKKIILLIIFLLILIAIPLTVFLARQRQENRQRAAPNTRLFIEPATLSKNINDQFTLDVKADPGANQIGAATLKLTFPSQYLEVLGIQKGPDAAGVLASGVFDKNAGTASISVNTSPTAPLQTVGILAQITFKALANTPANVPALVQFDFDPNNPENPDKTILSSPADADLGINIIQTISPGSVTIGGPAATPGPSASPTSSASASTNPNATPGPSASPGTNLTTKISSPATGSSSSNKRPTFSGTSFPNATVLIHINTSPAYIDQTQANASGAWSYTPTQDLAAGSYTLAVTGEDPNSTTTEDVSINFTVTSSGTGGTSVATPSPSPSASSTSSTTTTSDSSEKGGVPVTGNSTPTMLIVLLSIIFLGLGTGAALFYK